MSSPNPPLADDVAEAIGKALQLTLVELIALSLAGKQLQWTAYGREFVCLHGHLGRLVDEWRALEDVVATRASTLGIALEGTAAAVVELADDRPLEPGFTEVAAASEWLCTQLWHVSLHARQRAAGLGTLDVATGHVLLEVQLKLEQQLWMLRAVTPSLGNTR